MTSNSAPLHPGKILFDQVMVPLGVSRNKLARDIDVPVGRISDIVNGKRGVTPDTALRLARYFGTDAELWMRLQWEYDLYVARSSTWPNIEPRVRVFDPNDIVAVDDREALPGVESELPVPVANEPDPAPHSTEFAGAEPIAPSAQELGPMARGDEEAGPETDEAVVDDASAGAMTTEENMAAIGAAVVAEMAERPAAQELDEDRRSSPVGSGAGLAVDENTTAGHSTGDYPSWRAGDDAEPVDELTPSAAPIASGLGTDVEPLVLVDALEAEERAGAEPESAREEIGSSAIDEDDDLESLEIPDPDRIRFRANSD